jgi:hypothetical protein
MGDTQNTVMDDLAPSAPVDNGPLTASEADERLEALLGGNPETDPDDEIDGNSDAAPQPEEPTPDNPDEELDPAALAEDEGTVTEGEDPDASEPYSGGRFASDDAKVTLDDGTTISVADLKRGHLFQRDYTQKTTALAEERKAVEAKEAEYSQALAEFNDTRAWAQFVLQTYAPQQPQRPSVTAQQDPMAWLQYQEDVNRYNDAVNAYQALNQGQEAEKEKSTRETQAQAQQRLSNEIAELHKHYPALKDHAKAKAWFEDTFAVAAETYGFTMDELKSIPDHRFLRVLRDAYRAVKASKKVPEVKKEVQRKPPVAQGSGPRQNPEASQRREVDGLRKNLRETGSAAAAEALLAKLLG